jgi:hypothetical protein
MQNVAVISDSHSGHRSGLLAPDVKIETCLKIDGIEESDVWTPELSEINKYLWNLHISARDKAGSDPSDLSIIHLGELCWGAKHPSGAIDNSVATQVELGVASLVPWYELPQLKRVRILPGTDAHEFEDSSASILVTRELRYRYPNVDTKVVYHSLIDVDEITIDASHHGPYPGSRSWLRGNVASYYLRDRVMREMMAGRIPADLYLRGHYHTRVYTLLDIACKIYRLIIMPSMMVMNNYARKVTQSEYEITNGEALFKVNGNKMSEPDWITSTIDLRTKETWK